MSGPATEYSDIVDRIERLILDPQGGDPTVRSYMIARAALLWIARNRGGEKAGELAYKLADEMTTEVVR